jgi:hypothetical protein
VGPPSFFLPLAVINVAAGVLTSERVARLILAVEFIAIFAALGYQVFTLQERHSALLGCIMRYAR